MGCGHNSKLLLYYYKAITKEIIMEKKQLIVTIVGCAGSGKTTLANYIADILRDDGITVTVEDDPDGPLDANVHAAKMDRLFSDVDNFEVDIVTKQFPRQSAKQSVKSAALEANGNNELEADPMAQFAPAKIPSYLVVTNEGMREIPCRVVGPGNSAYTVTILLDPLNDGNNETWIVSEENIFYK